MRLVHLADLHLGARQLTRTTAAGFNAREQDIARAFELAIEATIALQPDAVVIAGDVFDNPRPPNTAIVHAHRCFLRLRSALPEAAIVIVAGNHDDPKAADTGSILALLDAIGVQVAAKAAKRFTYPELGLSVAAVPDTHGVQPVLEPDPGSRFNVAVIHGELERVAPDAAHGFDYIALGHFHVAREMGPRTCYSGSLDFVSSNPWGELLERSEKGFILADLAARTHEFHPIETVRPFLDLPSVDATGMTPADVNAAIAAVVEAAPGGIDGKVVRLVVTGIDRQMSRELDFKAIKAYRSRAFHFLLTQRRPEVVSIVSPKSAGRRAQLLRDSVAEALGSRELPADLPVAALQQRGLEYYDQATEAEEASNAAPETEEASV